MAERAERDDEYSLPAVQVVHLVDLVSRWNVAPEELLAETGLRLDELSRAGARVTIRDYVPLVQRARALTGEPGLGFHFGLRMRVSSHGYLGFAAMTAATVRDALNLASRFAPTVTTAFALRTHLEGNVGSLVIEERADFGPARDAIVFALMVGIWQIGIALTGRGLEGSAEVAFAEPPYYARFESIFPNVRFARPANQLLFDAKVLDLPLAMSDPAALQLATDQCERALDALGYDGNLVARVRRSIEHEVRTIEEVATELGLSARTLKRRLAAQGTAYSDLVDEVRREKALLLLGSSALSIDEVAERLGYSDLANFGRAFRRWTGTTPAAYRKSATGKG
jgi:AraC-like DNA-binding protein